MRYGTSEVDTLFTAFNQVCLGCKQSAQAALAAFLHNGIGLTHSDMFHVKETIRDDITVTGPRRPVNIESLQRALETVSDTGDNENTCDMRDEIRQFERVNSEGALPLEELYMEVFSE